MKAKEFPDLGQFRIGAGFRHFGVMYCGPVAASNALIWLALNGYPRLAPSESDPTQSQRKQQIKVIRELALPQSQSPSQECGYRPRGGGVRKPWCVVQQLN